MKYAILVLWLLMMLLLVPSLLFLTLANFNTVPLIIKIWMIFIDVCLTGSVVILGINIFRDWKNN